MGTAHLGWSLPVVEGEGRVLLLRAACKQKCLASHRSHSSYAMDMGKLGRSMDSSKIKQHQNPLNI